MTLALTAGEWQTRELVDDMGEGVYEEDGELWCSSEAGVCAVDLRNRRHGVAALALYGQPFGFTWEDVDVINKIVRRQQHIEEGSPVLSDTGNGRLRDLADRIAALLPPTEQS